MWDIPRNFMLGVEEVTGLTSGVGDDLDIGLFIQPALLSHFDFSLLLNERDELNGRNDDDDGDNNNDKNVNENEDQQEPMPTSGPPPRVKPPSNSLRPLHEDEDVVVVIPNDTGEELVGVTKGKSAIVLTTNTNTNATTSLNSIYPDFFIYICYLKQFYNTDCKSLKLVNQNYYFFSGNSVVRVRAQVMMRDDSTGGWVPMGGGGLSNVSVRKRKIHHEDDQPCKHEYLIHGKRISDQTIVLSCTIKKDFEYNKVMPTFHHWKTGNKKFGLTFQTAADARAFDKGVKMAIEDLLDGLTETSPLHQYNKDVGDEDVFMQLDLPIIKSSGVSAKRTSTFLSETSSYHNQHQHLPLHALSASSPAPPSEGCVGLRIKNDASFISSNQGLSPPDCWSSAAEQQQLHHERKHLLSSHDEETRRDKDYSYVKFPPQHFQASTLAAATHEYSYPKLVDAFPPNKHIGSTTGEYCQKNCDTNFPQEPMRCDDSVSHTKKGLHYPSSIPTQLLQHDDKDGLGESISFLKANQSGGSSSGFRGSPMGFRSTDPACLDRIKKGSAGSSSRQEMPSALLQRHKLTCAHCRESFSSEENPPGSCHYAPNCLRRGIETITCLQCAKCLLYHCLSDSEGDFVHPCECSNRDGHRTRRWIGLSLLSIIVPCLCCYLPLMACYHCGALCKMCGGRHQPVALHSSVSPS
eukprot:TCALIF_11291-PA protein Name:"Similar to Spred2 Sprouty-related, EVH1 domain-containing protein 2 (Rattus norvegicus)" AED:0.12 eAED:0.12 QI:0/0.6/0.5/0.66/0.6/0.66/6/393/690